MNTCNTEEICEGQNVGQINDLVPEKPQVVTVEPYKVKAYVSFEGVDKVDKRLHCWMAKQMMDKDPEIFKRKVRYPIFYKLLSINEDGCTGEALTNEPNVAHANFFITLNERTVFSTEVLHFVTSDKWQMRAHVENYLTEEQEQELKLRHARIEEREIQNKLEEEHAKQRELNNHPTADTPFELATWNLLVSDKDFPASGKFDTYEKAVADNNLIFGWWDGEEYFSKNYGKSPIAERKPDFQLVSVDRINRQVTVKEFTPCNIMDKENYSLSFVIWVDHHMDTKKINGVAGMYLLDMQPYLESQAIFDEQQAILNTLKEAEVDDGE